MCVGHTCVVVRNCVCVDFTATVGPAAEGEVRDSEKPGAVLLYIC